MNWKYALAAVIFFRCLASGTAQDLRQYFEDRQLEGSITLFDYHQEEWIKSDAEDALTGTLPASTFKIIHSLIALEEGVVRGIQDTLKWDGKPKRFKTFEIPAWNRDTDLAGAYKNSVVWYYTQLAESIKKRKYKKWLRKTKYGNGAICGGQGTDFWNYGPFEVTPVEQIQLLIGLSEENLPFEKRHQKTVKALMVEAQNDRYTLRGKTGWSYDGKDIGWYIGYLESEKQRVFFATRIQQPTDQPNPDFSKARKAITQVILSNLYGIKW